MDTVGRLLFEGYKFRGFLFHGFMPFAILYCIDLIFAEVIALEKKAPYGILFVETIILTCPTQKLVQQAMYRKYIFALLIKIQIYPGQGTEV